MTNILQGRSRRIHSLKNTSRKDEDPESASRTAAITEAGSEISPYEYIKKANLNQRLTLALPKKSKLSIKGRFSRKKSKEQK